MHNRTFKCAFLILIVSTIFSYVYLGVCTKVSLAANISTSIFNNNIIDYKLIRQYDKKEDIKKELKASIKTIDNIIYKSFDHYEKRLKDFQDLILISDKITLEELTA